MNMRKQGLAAAGVALAAALAAPTPAFAAGADILLPKPAEFVPALIAFIIIWVILAKMAWPMIIQTLDAREEKIAQDIQAAEDARTQAEKNVEAYEARLGAAEREANDIIANAKREAEQQRAQIIAKAQEDATAIVAKSRGVVEAERQKAMIQLSGSVVDLSVEIAGKIIGDALSVDEQHELAEKYLAEVGSLNDN